MYRTSKNNLTKLDYEILRFVEESKKLDITLEVYTPEQFEIIINREDRKSILVDNVSTTLPDFVLPRLGANSTYFTLAVIRHLERLGVYILNSSTSIDTVRDKLFTLQILAQSALPIPRTILAKFPVDINLVTKYFDFPLIVKTLSGSKGNGVFLSNDSVMFEDLMCLIYETNPNASIIFQEFIFQSKGKDLRILTLGNQALCAMERRSSTGGFKANFSLGGTTHYYRVDADLEKLCIQIVEILGLDLAGVDLLFDENGFKICEVNSSPGFKGMELANEVNVARSILLFILKSLESKKERLLMTTQIA